MDDTAINTPIKLLILADRAESFDELAHMIAHAPEIEMVGSATTGQEAVTLADIHQPDVVILDYDMAGLDASATSRSILKNNPATQIVMVSVVNDANDIRAAMRAGARDYLVKPLAEGELIGTIRWLIQERRDYARLASFVKQLRKAYDRLFWDDKPVPETVVAFLESQVAATPNDRQVLETLAVAYARNRDWERLLPVAQALTEHDAMTGSY